MRIKILSTGQVAELEKESHNQRADFKVGEELLVEADGIIESAFILCENSCVKPTIDAKKAQNIRVLRAFTEEDKIAKKQYKAKAEGYLEDAQAKVFRHGLVMKILDADLSFDQKKLTFYFSADSRVDFRALVADMMGSMGKIIRLQQVSAREERAHFGGYGKCGRPLCCVTFITDLDQVSSGILEMKSPKLAGCCGKPMCCLSYEVSELSEVKI